MTPHCSIDCVKLPLPSIHYASCPSASLPLPPYPFQCPPSSPPSPPFRRGLDADAIDLVDAIDGVDAVDSGLCVFGAEDAAEGAGEGEIVPGAAGLAAAVAHAEVFGAEDVLRRGCGHGGAGEEQRRRQERDGVREVHLDASCVGGCCER